MNILVERTSTGHHNIEKGEALPQFAECRAVSVAARLDEDHAIHIIRLYYIRDEAAVQHDSLNAGAEGQLAGGRPSRRRAPNRARGRPGRQRGRHGGEEGNVCPR